MKSEIRLLIEAYRMGVITPEKLLTKLSIIKQYQIKQTNNSAKVMRAR